MNLLKSTADHTYNQIPILKDKGFEREDGRKLDVYIYRLLKK